MLSVLMILSIGWIRPALADKPASIVGKVVEVSGPAWITHGKADKVEIKPNTEIKNDDLIVTGPATQLKVLLADKQAAFLVKKDSFVKFTRHMNQDWVIDLHQGMLLSQVRPLAKGSHFSVRTKTAVMGVRGTTFFTKAEPNKDLFLCTCQGVVSVDNKAIIIGKHHDSPKWIQSGNQPITARLKKAEMGSDHSDEEGAQLIQLLDQP